MRPSPSLSPEFGSRVRSGGHRATVHGTKQLIGIPLAPVRITMLGQQRATQIASSRAALRVEADVMRLPAVVRSGRQVRSPSPAGRRGASRSVLRCGDGLGTVFGRGPHVGHERLEPPEPQVIGAPPHHLVEQPRIDAAPDHRRRPQRTLGLVVLGPRVGPGFGKVTLADALELEGCSRLAPLRITGRRTRKPWFHRPSGDYLAGRTTADLAPRRSVLTIRRARAARSGHSVRRSALLPIRGMRRVYRLRVGRK